MKVEYDRRVDALYIGIHRGEVANTVEVLEGVNLDLDRDGRVIGLEILNALQLYRPEELFQFDAESLAVAEPVKWTERTKTP